MATKSKTKKSNESEKFAYPITGDYVDNVATPDTTTVEVHAKDDTDIGKKIRDIIEREYPRTRVGTDGYLQAILCELIRARLSK